MKKNEKVTLFSTLLLLGLSTNPIQSFAMEENKEIDGSIKFEENQNVIKPEIESSSLVMSATYPDQNLTVNLENGSEINDVSNEAGSFEVEVPSKGTEYKINDTTLSSEISEYATEELIVGDEDGLANKELDMDKEVITSDITINEITPTGLQGKTTASTEITIVFENGGKIQTLSDSQGFFNVSFSNQNIDSGITIKKSNGSNVEDSVLSIKVPVLHTEEQQLSKQENKYLANPKIDPLFSDSTFLTGKTMANVQMLVEFEDGTVISEYIGKNGEFKIDIPKLQNNEFIIVQIKNSEGQESKPYTITLQDNEVDKVVTEESTKLDTTYVAELDKNKEKTNLPKVSTFAATTAAKNGTTYYYVNAKDTLNSIAKKFNITTNQLIDWNNIKTPNIISSGTILSINGKNNYSNYDKEDRTFSSSSQFVHYLANYAKEVAYSNKHEKDLYASIMIAQAALESGYGKSGLAQAGNNLFGIKGDYNGYSIIIETKEEIGTGEMISIDAPFRFYPTFLESLLDNADKLRNGVDWDPYYYMGTWVENTNEYTDATSWLTGRYATDSNYGSKLNKVIEQHALTQYDKKLSTPGENSYDYGVWSNYSGGYRIAGLNDFNGQLLDITRKVTLTDGKKWVKFELNGRPIGWVGEQGINYLTNYTAMPVTDSYNYGIWDNYMGGNRVRGLNSYKSELLDITREAVSTDGSEWALFSVNGKKIGWVSKRGINEINTTVYYKGLPVADAYNYGIWSNFTGGSRLSGLNEYSGKQLDVVREVTNSDGTTWLKISSEGKGLGWISEQALDTSAVSSSELALPVSDAYNYGVWSNFLNGHRITGLNQFDGQTISIIGRATLPNGLEWVEFSANGKLIGWISTHGIDKYAVPVNYLGMSVSNAHNYGVWSNYVGGKRVAGLNEYSDKLLEVKKEANLPDGSTWIEFSSEGRIIGWVNKAGIDTNLVPANYTATPVVDAYNYGVWSNYIGGTHITGLDKYSNQLLQIKKEVTLSSGSGWVEFSSEGKTIGWVNKKGIDTNITPVNYTGMTVNDAYNYDVWSNYVSGNRVSGLNRYSNQLLEIKKEATLSDGSIWVEFSSEGKTIGWVNKEGINTSVIPADYMAVPVKEAYNYGVWSNYASGSRVTGLNKYLDQTLEVTKEATLTDGSVWVAFTVNGRNIGWVNKSGIYKK